MLLAEEARPNCADFLSQLWMPIGQLIPGRKAPRPNAQRIAADGVVECESISTRDASLDQHDHADSARSRINQKDARDSRRVFSALLFMTAPLRLIESKLSHQEGDAQS
jgi:hypothetical protein